MKGGRVKSLWSKVVVPWKNENSIPSAPGDRGEKPPPQVNQEYQMGQKGGVAELL